MIFTIVGTRPNFIKIDPELKQTIIHTGQHWDYQMSQIFFKELDLPKPKWNLRCKSNETGKMIDKLQVLFQEKKPTLILVFGDTNSALAGAIAAAYCNISVVHIEAGMRSYRRDMPEEINRVIIDHIAKVNICPNYYAQTNLLKEGIKDNVFTLGDPSFDTLGKVLPCKKSKNFKDYLLLTLHRNFNSDNKQMLEEVFQAIKDSGEKTIFPVHPRTRKNIRNFKIEIPKNIKMVNPKSYKEFICLISNAKKVLTDSGGVQREAFWMQIPVIILRLETEWIDIVSKGAGFLANSKEEILRGIKEFKGQIIAPPQAGVNKKIREVLYRYA